MEFAFCVEVPFTPQQRRSVKSKRPFFSFPASSPPVASRSCLSLFHCSLSIYRRSLLRRDNGPTYRLASRSYIHSIDIISAEYHHRLEELIQIQQIVECHHEALDS
eukprot:scaffold102214_cov38-Attheya_sp.AAC.2